MGAITLRHFFKVDWSEGIHRWVFLEGKKFMFLGLLGGWREIYGSGNGEWGFLHWDG